MRRYLPLLLALALALTGLPTLTAAENTPAAASSDKSPFGTIATAVTTVTGIAVSPLLGTGAYGAYEYFKADTPEQKAKLPWFAQPSFWIPGLLLVGACACKDSLGAVLPPGMKKPLDVMETVENKVSGLVAAGAVVPLTMGTLTSLITKSGQADAATLHASGLAMMHVGALDFSWLLNLLTVPFGIAIFAIVWMASHAINVLILLSPWGAVDAALKSARVTLLGLLTLSAQLDPKYAAILSLVVIVVAYLVAGWAFRLTIFGSTFCWDFFTGAKHRFEPTKAGNSLFSGKGMEGVPVRTLGKLIPKADGNWDFTYRPWLVLAERTVVVKPSAAFVAKGLFFSTLRDGDRTLAILPPRFRDHESALAVIYGLPGGVKDAGLLKAWSALRELFSGTSTHVQAT